MTDNKRCYNCQHFKPYYTKGYTQFDKTELGLCTKTKTTNEKYQTCENFVHCYYGRVGTKEAACRAVVENINLLAELKQILEDDTDEALEEFLTEYRREKRKANKQVGK